jgi:hypothetical protein
MAGTCPPMVSGDFTPSFCKVKATGQNATITTTAQADAMFKTYPYKGFTNSMTDDAKIDLKRFYETLFCGQDKVKAEPANDWRCGFFKYVVTSRQCAKATTCPISPSPACESFNAMMTAVCTLTADEVKAEVAKAKTDGSCKDKADGGIEFKAEAAAAAPTTTPKPAAASGSSPMWALALAACLFAGVPAVSRSV